MISEWLKKFNIARMDEASTIHTATVKDGNWIHIVNKEMDECVWIVIMKELEIEMDWCCIL